MSYGPGWGSVDTAEVPIGTLGYKLSGLQAFADWTMFRPSVHMWVKLLLVLKALVLFYWLWVARVLGFGNPEGFDAIIAISAPMFVSFHFVQALLLLRRIKSEQPYWLQLAQTLAFGALYLAPLLLKQPSNARAQGVRSRRT